MDSAFTAWVAVACDKVLGQELPPEEEELHADLVAAAKKKELDA